MKYLGRRSVNALLGKGQNHLKIEHKAFIQDASGATEGKNTKILFTKGDKMPERRGRLF